MVKAKRGALVFKVVLCVFLALILGLGITALSAFMPAYLESASEFYVIDYGSPIAFVQQTTNVVPNPSYFPLYFTPKYWHESFEFEIMTGNLVLSAVINVLIFAVIVFGIWLLHHLYRKKHPKKVKISKKDLYRPVFSEASSEIQDSVNSK